MVKQSLLALCIFLAACSPATRVRTEIQYVNTPVPMEVPEKMKQYQLPAKPKFISPDSKEAVTALDKANAEVLQQLIFSMYGRNCELEAFLAIRKC